MQRSTRPTISVLLPVLNGEQYLDTAVSSILNQTFTDFEFLILVDEASHDGSLSIAQRWAAQDARVRVLVNPHGRIGAALNFGFAHTQGAFIALIEADDTALTHRFATQLPFLRENQCDLCGSCAKIFQGTNTLYWFAETHEALRIDLLFRSALHPSTIMMKRAVLENHTFDPDTIFQDYEFWTRIVHHTRLANIPQVLAKIRTHPQQAQQAKQEAVAKADAAIKFAYLQTLYPQLSTAEKAPLLQLMNRRPLRSLADLAAAGAWLVKLSTEIEEKQMQRSLASRWFNACFISAQLGPSVLSVYQNFSQNFPHTASFDLARLETACSR